MSVEQPLPIEPPTSEGGWDRDTGLELAAVSLLALDAMLSAAHDPARDDPETQDELRVAIAHVRSIVERVGGTSPGLLPSSQLALGFVTRQRRA